MRIATKILNRVIGVQFYQRNAAMFLFIFILMFGIIPGQQLFNYHLTLIYAMLGSTAFMIVVCLIWLLYAAKCAQFTLKIMSDPPYQFLYVISNLSGPAQFYSLLLTQVFIYLPVLIYSVIIAVAGISAGQVFPSIFVILFNVFVCLLSTILYRKKLNHPDPEKSYFLSLIIRFHFVKSYPLFFISQLLNEMKVIFVVTKFFSLLIIIAFLNGFFIDTYDSRVVWLGFLAGLIAHCVMVFEFRKFEETFLTVYRNLPVSLTKRFLMYASVYALILMPEWIIFATAIPSRLHAADSLWLPFFGIGVLLLLHCLMYRPSFDMEIYLPRVFAIFAVLFFLILYKLYLFIDIGLLATSLLCFRMWYYEYEPAQLTEETNLD